METIHPNLTPPSIQEIRNISLVNRVGMVDVAEYPAAGAKVYGQGKVGGQKVVEDMETGTQLVTDQIIHQ